MFHLTSASTLWFWSDFPVVKQLYLILLHNFWKFTRTLFHSYFPYFNQDPKFHSSTFERIIQFLFLDLFWGCEATIFYIASKILKLIQDLKFHIWCNYAKIHIILSSHFLSKIPSSFCPDSNSVKEVPFWYIQMSWKFSSISIPLYCLPTPKFSSFHQARWVQLQDSVSGPEFALERKCMQNLSKWPQILQEPTPFYHISVWQGLSFNPLSI